MDSDEAEMREAEVRTAERWSAIMNRARAEIHAAYSAAHAAVNGISAEALQQARTARDSADADWHSDWFVEPVISGYEIKRLQNIVANEQGLLDLNLIPSSAPRNYHSLSITLSMLLTSNPHKHLSH